MQKVNKYLSISFSLNLFYQHVYVSKASQTLNFINWSD